MYTTARLGLILILAMLAGPVLAETDPSLSEVYEAARTGHLDHAQQMMNEVLRDHPRSAKAHYVRAELYAKQGNLAMGRQELGIARSLQPGLPFATADSVRALEAELSRTGLSRPQSEQAGPTRVLTGPSFAWLPVALFVLAGVALWVAFRGRRSSGNVYSPPRDAMAPPAASPGTAVGAGVSPSVGAAVGTGVVGGLATGLAAGAGIVAGEEIARHLLEPGRREDNTAASEPVRDLQNDDPVQPDFGVSGGDSWDDDGPAADAGGGNDDWS